MSLCQQHGSYLSANPLLNSHCYGPAFQQKESSPRLIGNSKSTGNLNILKTEIAYWKN
jgi:hypothetical protein